MASFSEEEQQQQPDLLTILLEVQQGQQRVEDKLDLVLKRLEALEAKAAPAAAAPSTPTRPTRPSTTTTTTTTTRPTTSTTSQVKPKGSTPSVRPPPAAPSTAPPTTTTRHSAAGSKLSAAPSTPRPPPTASATGRKSFMSTEKVASEPRLQGAGAVTFKPMKSTVYPPSTIGEIETGVASTAGAPKRTLELESVLGYRGKDAFDNVHALRDNRLVFYAAATAVVCVPQQNSKAWIQVFYTEHDDDIMSLAVHHDEDTVATGQVAAKPCIKVWSASTLETLATLTGGHERAVASLAFSSSSENNDVLISVGRDDNNTVCVWDWKHAPGTPLLSVRGGQDKVLFCTSLDPTLFVTAGVKHLRFWSGTGAAINPKKGIFGKAAEIHNVFAVLALPSATGSVTSCVSGGSSGQLCFWNTATGECEKAINDAHDGSVFALCAVRGGGFASGGKDGLIKVWRCQDGQTTYSAIAVLHTAGNSAVRALAHIADTGSGQSDAFSFWVGTGTNSIERCVSGNGDQSFTMTKGHTAEVWGLAISQTSPAPGEYILATAGSDQALHLWRVAPSQRVLLQSVSLEDEAHACDFSPCGASLAVGLLDGSVHMFNVDLSATDGVFLKSAQSFSAILSSAQASPKAAKSSSGALVAPSSSRAPVTTPKKSSAEKTSDKAKSSRRTGIDQIRFSPSGNDLAVGTHERVVVLFGKVNSDGPSQWKRRAMCKGHSSFIAHLDWSLDGNFLQTNSGDYEYCAWDAKNGAQLTRAELVRDISWCDWTLPFGWCTEGIWGDANDGTDINAVHKSHDSSFFVTGDDFSHVNLFAFPPTGQNAPHYRFKAHSSHVMNTRITNDDQRVISCGGQDGCAFVWKVVSLEQGSLIDL